MTFDVLFAATKTRLLLKPFEFGEFPGYYGRPEAGCPLVEVTAVHHRTNPILTNALMADYPSCEQSGFFSVIRSARIWDDFDALVILPHDSAPLTPIVEQAKERGTYVVVVDRGLSEVRR